MRPIYWGLVLTFAGICSYIILSLVARFFWTREMDGFLIVTMPPALTYITIFAIYFSLPLAITIEAYLFLKGRKGEAKGNEEIA